METEPRPSSQRQRWIVPVLALLFMGPLAAAWYFYYAGDGWRPGASVNHGRLITPAVTLQPPGDGAWSELSDHWSIVVVGNAACYVVRHGLIGSGCSTRTRHSISIDTRASASMYLFSISVIASTV